MIAVMHQPTIVTAFGQRSLIAVASNIVKPYKTSSNKMSGWIILQYQMSKRKCSPSVAEAKHSTNYRGVFDIPVVVTNCAPGSIVQNLQSAKRTVTIT